MIVHKNLSTSGSRSKPIVYDIYLPENKAAQDLILFSHGFKGFKDWGTFDSIGRFFAGNGYAFVKFNFSYNGTSPDDLLNFCDLEAFGKNTYSTELDDLGIMIDKVTETSFRKKFGIETGRLVLMGHSRGGGITLAAAASEEKVDKVITMAAVSDLGRMFTKEAVEKWREKGVEYILNGRTGQQMPLRFSLYEDYIANLHRLDLMRVIPDIKAPVLIAHGTADEAVPFSSAKSIDALCQDSELLTIRGGNHVFGGSHPWEKEELPDHLHEVLQKALSFIRKE